MSDARAARDFMVGSELIGPVRVVTRERIQWYDSAMLSAAKDELARVGSNIHTDDAFARTQGLPAVIADGMISTNWISSMLVQYFGLDYVARGELRTKFIKPIFLGAVVSVRGLVTAVEREADGGVRYGLDVWCEDEKAVKLTVGDARVEVAPHR